jgi:hypothetical protein
VLPLSEDVVSDACELVDPDGERAAVPAVVVVPSSATNWKVTLPVGAPPPTPVEVTVAVIVTGWLSWTFVLLSDSVVDVATIAADAGGALANAATAAVTSTATATRARFISGLST